MSNRTLIPFIGILLGTSTNMFMQTVVATILPQMINDLGDAQLYGWVFSSFLLFSTITIPLFANLADTYGYRKFYILGMTIFLTGSLLCGLSFSMSFLIGGRVIQGLGVGILGPVTIAMISHLFSIEERGKAMGIYAGTQLLANVAGPVIGGEIAQTFDWAWAFYMVIPLGLLSIIFIIGFREKHGSRKYISSKKRLDVIGALLLGGCIACFIQGFTRWGDTGFDLGTIVLLSSSALLFVRLIYQEKKHQNPVIPPSLFQVKNVRLANNCAFFVGLLMYGTIAILPLYMDKIAEGSSVRSGELLIPLMVGLGLGVIISGRVIKRFRYKTLARIGWGTSFIGYMILGLFSVQNEGGFWVHTVIFITGLGVSSLLPTVLLPAQNAVSKQQQALVGGMIQLCRNSGGAIGIPILTGLLTISKETNGFWMVFLFLAVCTLIGWIIGSGYSGSVQEEVQRTEKI